jgi:hypothetical protein
MPGNGVAIGLPANISSIIQTGYLQKRFVEALKPKTKYRREAKREDWPGREAGQTMTMTRRALLDPKVKANKPGVEPPTASTEWEQWIVSFDPYNLSLETHLPSSAVAMVKKFLDDAVALAENAGWSIDRVARNALYTAYGSGQTFTTATVSASTSVPVTALAGFRKVLNANGQLVDVSASTPLSVTVAGVANKVTGVAPTYTDWPDGPGVLTLQTAVTIGTTRQFVYAANRPYLSLPSGCTTLDDITTSKPVTWSQLLMARNRMARDRVPRFADGTYHFHADPDHVKQILDDATTKQLFQGQPGSDEMKMGAFSRQYGITFIENDDNPSYENITEQQDSFGSVVASSEIGDDVVNAAGLPLRRSILLGRDALYEMYVPEGNFQAEADGTAAGSFGTQVQMPQAAGFEADMEGILYVVRPGLDALMRKPLQSYSLTAGWVAASDSKSKTSLAAYKRAVTLVSCAAL